MRKKWRPFEEAREFIRSRKLKNQGEWLEYSKSGESPADTNEQNHALPKQICSIQH